jgi:FkbM family methyltransferase
MDLVGYRCPVRCELINGMMVVVCWNEDIGRAIYDHHAYEPATLSVFSRLCLPGSVVFDIGAHVGQFALTAAGRVAHGGEVHAFECDPTTYKWLDRNVGLNGLGNVRLNDCALSDAEGLARLYLASTRDTGSNSLVGPAWVDSGKTVEVPTITLDGYCSKHLVTRIDVVKLDVEGAELQVLKGAERVLTQMRPKWIIEFEEERQRLAGTSCAELARYLTDRGYRLQRIGAELTEYRPDDGERSVNVLAAPISPRLCSSSGSDTR